MPLIDLPARALLRLPGQTDIAWAVFDPDWYLTSHPDAAARMQGAVPEEVLAFYLEFGQALGHSPNLFFDEAWHRRIYPKIAARVEEGEFASAYDAYCRGGSDRSPHWLFEELPYRRRYPDLTDAALVEGGVANGYDHYLRHGSREGRIGHPTFDAALYRAQLAADEVEAVERDGPFLHYLRRIASAGPEIRTSPYFAPAWYLARYPEVTEAIARREWLCSLHHYLCNATPTAFDPLPDFSEVYYLARYPDLVPVVEDGSFRNGYVHFLRHGVQEARSPSEPIDLAYYAALEEVRSDIEHGLAPDAFAHWLTIGRAKGLQPAPPIEERITEAQAKTLFRRKADMLRPLFGRAKLHFLSDRTASVSVVVVLHNRFALTMMALASLQASYPGDIELILVDSGSTDETRFIARYVDGATVLRFEDNVGFLRGCNAALNAVNTEAVLFLNNDVELAPGAVPLALQRLQSDPKIGAVGGKVVRTHGLLQEAGSIVWRDGSTTGYLRDESPLAPEANFVRDVDFCSGVFLLVRTDVLRALDGFDEAYAPAYYEDTDLCVRINAAGYRVVYDPSVMIHHLEYGSATSVRASEAEIGFRRNIFVRKHAAWLEMRPEPSGPGQLTARLSDTAKKRVLFIEDQLPLRSIGSGFVRSNDILQTMAALGYAVTVFPLLPTRFDLSAVYADMPDTVEVMHDRTLDQLQEFLLLRKGYYDVIWVERTHNLARIRPMLNHLAREQVLPPVILDSEAIAAVREAQVAAHDGAAYDLLAAVREEFAGVHDCARIIAVNGAEAALLHEVGLQAPAVLGHMRRPIPTPRPFARRTGMLFVGAMHRMDSPNYDSLCWFVDEVLPLVERALGWETRLTVVGYQGAEVSLDRFADHPRVTLRGAIATEPLYDSHKMFVAPTRIAAGTPYKVHEAASFGLPVVATELLQRQLGWDAGEDLLAAEATDTAGFADAIIRLHRDEALWQRLRSNALARLEREASPAHYAATLADLLGPATAEGRL
ncbi:MAG: glycosyltransferase [Acetobacteraceae bacterium]|nr:glycosyltransferase [Acetobacteraceae bacterium]